MAQLMRTTKRHILDWISEAWKNIANDFKYRRRFDKSPVSLEPPTDIEVLRYRYQHGVNLGGVFLLEKGFHPSFFAQITDNDWDSELDAVDACAKRCGLARTQQLWEGMYYPSRSL